MNRAEREREHLDRQFEHFQRHVDQTRRFRGDEMADFLVRATAADEDKSPRLRELVSEHYKVPLTTPPPETSGLRYANRGNDDLRRSRLASQYRDQLYEIYSSERFDGEGTPAARERAVRDDAEYQAIESKLAALESGWNEQHDEDFHRSIVELDHGRDKPLGRPSADTPLQQHEENVRQGAHSSSAAAEFFESFLERPAKQVEVEAHRAQQDPASLIEAKIRMGRERAESQGVLADARESVVRHARDMYRAQGLNFDEVAKKNPSAALDTLDLLVAHGYERLGEEAFDDLRPQAGNPEQPAEAEA